jgi:anti-sigma factor RsiW
MRLAWLTLASALFLVGCAAQLPHPPAGTPMQRLTIRWQRLVNAADETCPRCASTGEEVDNAVAHLRRSLAPAGIDVVLTTQRLDEATFAQAPLESNRIWIAERALEEWLGARAASSPCCDACGDSECRTVCAGGQTYEAIPASLIIRAGLLAAGELLRAGAPAPDSSSVESGERSWNWSWDPCSNGPGKVE